MLLPTISEVHVDDSDGSVVSLSSGLHGSGKSNISDGDVISLDWDTNSSDGQGEEQVSANHPEQDGSRPDPFLQQPRNALCESESMDAIRITPDAQNVVTTDVGTLMLTDSVWADSALMLTDSVWTEGLEWMHIGPSDRYAQCVRCQATEGDCRCPFPLHVGLDARIRAVEACAMENQNNRPLPGQQRHHVHLHFSVNGKDLAGRKPMYAHRISRSDLGVFLVMFVANRTSLGWRGGSFEESGTHGRVRVKRLEAGSVDGPVCFVELCLGDAVIQVDHTFADGAPYICNLEKVWNFSQHIFAGSLAGHVRFVYYTRCKAIV